MDLATRLPAQWRFPSFSNAQEAAFQRQYADQIATFFRVFHPYGALLYLAFLYWDWTLAPEVVAETAPWRLGATLFIGGTVALSFHSSFSRIREGVCLAITLVMSLVLAWILYLVPRGFELGTSGMMLCLIFSLGMWRVRPALAVVAYAILLATCTGLMAAKGVDRATFASTVMMLVSAFGLCLLYHHLLELQSRRFFELESTLRTEKERIEELLQQVHGERQERLDWLENLAGFLRHELSNQMIGVRSSLDLLETRDPNPRSIQYVERARRSVRVMETLLRSAGEATSVETMLDDDELERFDAGPLMAAWARAAADVHPGRRLTVVACEGCLVRGTEERLVQALDKILQNALEHSGPGDAIRCRVHCDSEHVTLEVENEGDALPEDRERMFQPFASGRKRKADGGNLGIGLYVARLISRRLGGELRAEPLSADGGARFVLTLPLDPAAAL